MKTTTTILLVLSWTSGAMAFSSGPPNARTGAPGETNCTACHSTFPVNSGNGGVSVSGVPGSWTPGADYDLTVLVEDDVAMRWGYEFTILDEGGSSVGTLTDLDADSQISSSGNRTYAKHTSSGTRPGTGVSATWTVRWTAPEAGTGDVTFYAAGNGANFNGANSGDRIYTTSVTWSEESVASVGAPLLADARLGANYPNPFNPRTSIDFELARGMEIRLAVYALDGSLVRLLVTGFRAGGPHTVQWDGEDRAGRAMPSGVYLYRLQTDEAVHLRRMTLVR